MILNLKRCYFGFLVVLIGMTCQQSLAALSGEYLFENNTLDTSGLGRDGTAGGSPTFTTGLYQGSPSAIQMPGAQTVELPPNTDFIRNAPGATLLAWVRADDLSGESKNIVVVNNADASAGIGSARALLEFTPGSGFRAIGRQADTGGSTTVTGNPPGGSAAVGQTYFLAGVFDYVNGDVILYINGQVAAQNLNVTTWTMNSADSANLVARIGSHANGTQQFWNGALDGVRIYDEVLSPTAISDIYALEAFPPGDTNHNGFVEADDLDPIRLNWRQTGKAFAEGNLNGTGLVDFADFRIWKTGFLNSGSGSLAGVDLGFLGAAVPEPSAVCLLIIGALFGWNWRGARRLSSRCFTVVGK
jgi:hypothetical protein